MRKLVIHIVVGLWVLGLGPHTLLAGDSALKAALEAGPTGLPGRVGS